MTRFVEGERLDDADELIHNHAWVENKPVISGAQLSELLVVLRPWYEQELAQPKRVKVTVRNGPPKVDKGSQHTARRLVRERSGGLCEICSLAVAREFHHRKNRSQGGGWSAANGMDLCTMDHQFITGHPELAVRNGWTVRSFEHPEVTPLLRRGQWVRLDDEGGVFAVEGDVA